MKGDLRYHLKILQLVHSQICFEDLRAEWSVPGNGNSLTSIDHFFYTVSEGTIEDLKVTLVDAPEVALHSGAIFSKERDNVLKDFVDRKNETALKKIS